MKKIVFSLLGAALLFGACEDRLDIQQKGVISVDDFYHTDDDAQNALNNLYQCLALNVAGNEGIYVALPVLFNEPADDMLAAGSQYGDNDFGAQINEFRYDYDNEVIRNAYIGLYSTIYDSNTILEKVDDGSALKKRVRAEARAIRAWAHLMLAIGWGNPIVVQEVLAPDAKPANDFPGGQKGILEWVATEAEAAVADLDARQGPKDDVGASKATKGFALAIAGKAALFAGDNARAKSNLEQIINSNNYELVSAERWPNLFHASGDLNEEKIFEINVLNNAAVGDWSGKINRSSWMFIQFWNWRTDRMASRPAFIGADGWGGHAIRADFAQEMLDWEGDSPRRKATFMTEDEFFYTMKWNGTDGMTKAQLETSPLIGLTDGVNGIYGVDKFFAHKFVAWPEDNEMGWYGFKNLCLFRYAEVLLMYAEACVGNDNGSGLKALNDIQKRAGAPVTDLTLDNVKREKKHEMWLEMVRWPDMVRWGDTGGVVNNGKNIPITRDLYFVGRVADADGKVTTPGKSPIHKFDVEYTNPNLGKVGFVKGKHEYFAFPKNSVEINENLVQNPSGL
ncbi:MAG: RagB/SusD family nutrient uptake outer membrane protein [Prevotellaceae bacterium]|jgi:hypothetical protein|nr:RagB/SusD family nutrient uptake outer membrane protein [Prevotellaceae bacterium]